MKTRTFSMFGAVLAVVLSGACGAGWAGADVIHSVLDAPGAMAGFQGTTHFDGTDTIAGQTRRLVADVDYAVFAPGTLPASLGAMVPGLGFGSPNAGDYYYAFQVFDVGSPDAGQASLPVDILSVDLKPGASYSSAGEASVSDPAAVPVSLALVSDAARYVFFMQEINPGEHSRVLLLSSSTGPGMTASYVLGGAAAPLGDLPSPATSAGPVPVVPTPTSAATGVALLGVGQVGRVIRRRRASR